MNRVVLVYNKRSSHAQEVQEQVAKPLHELFPQGIIEYQIKPTSFEDNTKHIAKLLRDHDLVIAAGGDGTAAITANGVLASKHRQIRVGFLGYGNFNDIAHTFSHKKSIHDLIIHHENIVDVYPLDISIDGKHFRYAVLYATFGLLAGAANEFEDRAKRNKLQNGGANFLSSLFALLPYYLRSKNTVFLPPNDISDHKITDYLAVNGPRMAKAFRTNSELYRTELFLQTNLNVSRFFATSPFVLRSLFGHMPGTLKHSDHFSLKTPSSLDLQTDGEYRLLEQVHKITITKPRAPLHVIKPR